MRVVLRALEREQAGRKRELIERVEEIARDHGPHVADLFLEGAAPGQSLDIHASSPDIPKR